MGALTSNRKRGDLIDQSSGHNSKKPKLAGSIIQNTSENHWPDSLGFTVSGHRQYLDRVWGFSREGDSRKNKFSVSLNQNMPENHQPKSSNPTVSRLSQYPDTKPGFRREVHAPVRNSRYRPSPAKSTGTAASSKGSPADKIEKSGLLGRCYDEAKNLAMGTLRYLSGKQKEKEVIEVDSEDESLDGMADDSSIEVVEIVGLGNKWKGPQGAVENSLELNATMVETDVRSLDSSAITDVSNAIAKMDGKKNGLLLLDRVPDDNGGYVYKKKYESAKKRDDKIANIDFDIEMVNKRLEGIHLLWPLKKEEPAKKDVAKECFLPLTEDEENEVCRAMSNMNRRKVLVTHENSNIDITGEKLQCLRPGAWLNDEVINVYLELLKERERREPRKFLKCHFFNTFFYKKLISGGGGYNFQSVRRWTTQRKLGYSLLECDKIFVPIHKEIHWCLAIINKKDQKFQYLDSLGGTDNRVLDVLTRYFVEEVKDKCGKDIDISSWAQEFVMELPEQENGFDCGMFMVKYADFFSRDVGLCFCQENMPYFRLRTAKEILKLRAE